MELSKEFIEAMEFNSKTPVRQIQIDAQVVLKLMQHCMEKLPVPVTGILLGLDKEEDLEVTNCFPLPSLGDFEYDESNDDGTTVQANAQNAYQLEMLQSFKELNADANAIGWYQSSFDKLSDQYLNLETTIETQYAYQLELGQKCICLIFDPIRCIQGHLELKAVRLSEKFMDLIRRANLTILEERATANAVAGVSNVPVSGSFNINELSVDELRDLHSLDPNALLPSTLKGISFSQELMLQVGLKSEDIFEELPVKVHNFTLLEKYWDQLLQISHISNSAQHDEKLQQIPIIQTDGFHFLSTPIVERNYESLITSAEGFLQEYSKYQNYQKKVAQVNKKKEKTEEDENLLKNMTQPDRLQTLIHLQQMNQSGQYLNQFAQAQQRKVGVLYQMVKEKK